MQSLLDDLPELDDANLWEGLSGLADRLARQIPSLPTTSPVLVSGDWGSGKTTLLRAIQRQISGSERRTLFFEAWRYEAEAFLLPALLRAIWELIPEEEREEKASLGSRLWKTAVTLSVGTGASLAKLVGGPTSLVVEALLALHKDEKQDKEEKAKRPPGPPADLTLELQRDFHKLLSTHWTVDEPLIVFIDDLDRCGAQGTVGLLEALRMLLHQTTCSTADLPVQLPCRFVVALDRKVLTHAVALRYEGFNRYDGNRYLEKLFPFSFELPQPQGGDVHLLISKVLRGINAAGRATATEAPKNELDALATALGEPSFANPRLIKRCVNRFRLILQFEREAPARSAPARHRRDEDAAGRLETLARWIAAAERWPNLRRLLASRGDEFWQQLRDALQTNGSGSLDADVRALLQEDGVEAWMRAMLLNVRGDQTAAYREADRRLRAWGL